MLAEAAVEKQVVEILHALSQIDSRDRLRAENFNETRTNSFPNEGFDCLDSQWPDTTTNLPDELMETQIVSVSLKFSALRRSRLSI
jgi:hypothetical protein